MKLGKSVHTKIKSFDIGFNLYNKLQPVWKIGFDKTTLPIMDRFMPIYSEAELLWK